VTAIPFESLSPSDRKAVREELDRILKSDQFLQSRRRRRFLEYVVNETLAGRGGRLKGYSIAREVFDRPEEFDPNTDSIVRMEAARLRDRLREYYEGDGRNNPIRIELPKGTYTPQIEFRQAIGATPPDRDRFSAESAAALKDEAPSPPHPWWNRWQIAALVATPVICWSPLVVVCRDPLAARARSVGGSRANPPRCSSRGSTALHQSERRSQAGLFQRRPHRGHLDRAFAGARSPRARPQYDLPI
jgi:hypothetical protein